MHPHIQFYLALPRRTFIHLAIVQYINLAKPMADETLADTYPVWPDADLACAHMEQFVESTNSADAYVIFSHGTVIRLAPAWTLSSPHAPGDPLPRRLASDGWPPDYRSNLANYLGLNGPTSGSTSPTSANPTANSQAVDQILLAHDWLYYRAAIDNGDAVSQAYHALITGGLPCDRIPIPASDPSASPPQYWHVIWPDQSEPNTLGHVPTIMNVVIAETPLLAYGLAGDNRLADYLFPRVIGVIAIR